MFNTSFIAQKQLYLMKCLIPFNLNLVQFLFPKQTFLQFCHISL